MKLSTTKDKDRKKALLEEIAKLVSASNIAGYHASHAVFNIIKRSIDVAYCEPIQKELQEVFFSTSIIFNVINTVGAA
jgi:hypothetical protein